MADESSHHIDARSFNVQRHRMYQKFSLSLQYSGTAAVTLNMFINFIFVSQLQILIRWQQLTAATRVKLEI